MTDGLQTAWNIAQHLAELTAAHALFETGKAQVKAGAEAAANWVRAHLGGALHDKIDAVAKQPEHAPAKAELAVAINKELVARAELLAQAQELLSASGAVSMSQSVGAGGRAIQNQGADNSNTIIG